MLDQRCNTNRQPFQTPTTIAIPGCPTIRINLTKERDVEDFVVDQITKLRALFRGKTSAA